MTHPSYGRRPWPTTSPLVPSVIIGDYQRLEFLGDALLDFIVLTQMYLRHPGWDPGRLTAEKAALVGNSFLAWVATDQLQVYKHLFYDDLELMETLEKYVSVSMRDPLNAPKPLADVLESLIAAVYLDSFGDMQLQCVYGRGGSRTFHLLPSSIMMSFDGLFSVHTHTHI